MNNSKYSEWVAGEFRVNNGQTIKISLIVDGCNQAVAIDVRAFLDGKVPTKNGVRFPIKQLPTMTAALRDAIKKAKNLDESYMTKF